MASPVRLIAALSLPILLAGCGIPTSVSAVSYAADGLSAGASGKTVNDHLVSQIVNMDCGLLRFLRGEWICRDRGIDPDDNTIYTADGRSMDGPPRPWGTIAEPDLQYDDGNQHDARGWAEGIEIADAPALAFPRPDSDHQQFIQRPRQRDLQQCADFVCRKCPSGARFVQGLGIETPERQQRVGL